MQRKSVVVFDPRDTPGVRLNGQRRSEKIRISKETFLNMDLGSKCHK